MDVAAIRDGMTAYSADGKKLGKIVKHDDDTAVVEKGLFFKKDYVVDLEDVGRIIGDDVWLRVNHDVVEDEERDDRRRRAPAAASGTTASAVAAAGGDDGTTSTASDAELIDDADVMVIEEEVVVVAAPAGSTDAGISSPGSPDRDPNTRE